MEKAAFSRGIEGVGYVWIETCWNKDWGKKGISQLCNTQGFELFPKCTQTWLYKQIHFLNKNGVILCMVVLCIIDLHGNLAAWDPFSC